ncbi:calcium uniporter protein, mitochondrial isoform X2 [Orussus abietinus]|uniref:calcium uniporter protein, mitochondrial isoform X2 n=1 Tax=Orussus abietinus TaxID=222816 RepID=UPI0006255DF7|nr:calcium uniporter protein, mitochondrial isoform X2 [Orussus abietinus]
MAGAVPCRAFVVLRLEITRVLSATPLTAARKYRNETWCRRWWSNTQRGLSTSAGSFAPVLSPILRKDAKEGRQPKDSKDTRDPRVPKDLKNPRGIREKTAITAESIEASEFLHPKSRERKRKRERSGDTSCTGRSGGKPEVREVAVSYYRGLPRITVPLTSRKEKCVFNLKPITHTVGDFLDMLKKEDPGIDRATVYTINGTRISAGTTIECLLEEDFRLVVNDVEYVVTPPRLERHTMEELEKLNEVRTLVSQLYDHLHVREHNADLEKQVVSQLEELRLELEPLEQKRAELEVTAERRATFSTWIGLFLMSVQFGILARLTWWEYSWDIMEPITYFVTYGTAMAYYIYFLLTREEYMMPDVLNRRHLLVLHKKAKKEGLDLNYYNDLKDQAYELETMLKILRGPLHEKKQILEQKRQNRDSSSSSRSPSSSPSPSPSPSPERSVPKKATVVPAMPS